jgi:crossover junction endodeoxyribonuclease RuvC
MRILGIDPGYERLGVAVIEKNGRGECLLYSTCIRTSPKKTFPERLEILGKELTVVLESWKPEVLATETLYMTKNQKTAIPVAGARGVILYLAQKHGLTICEYSPQAIKIALTGYGNSSKAQVTAMIPRLIRTPTKKTVDDEYDAIAAALTCAASIRSR